MLKSLNLAEATRLNQRGPYFKDAKAFRILSEICESLSMMARRMEIAQPAVESVQVLDALDGRDVHIVVFRLELCAAVGEQQVDEAVQELELILGRLRMSEELDLEYEEFLKKLGARIKKMHNDCGLSLRDTVAIHGYHDSQWRRWERGGSINLQSLLRIAKSFRTSLSDLLDRLGSYPAESMPEIEQKMSPAR